MFIADDSGAVTVDWTVMTAAVVGLGIASYGVVSTGIGDLSSDVSAHLGGFQIYEGFGTVVSFENFANGLSGWTFVGTPYDDPEIEGGSGVFLLDDGLFIERALVRESDNLFILGGEEALENGGGEHEIEPQRQEVRDRDDQDSR